MNHAVGLALAATIGMFVASDSFAATRVGSLFQFTPRQNTFDFNVRPHSWSDPSFGHKGWTHHANWGQVRARRGDVVTIELTSAVPGINPAATVWFRGARDTAPNNYVPDHFYNQLGDFSKIGAIHEATNVEIGDIVMRYVTHGYDRDGNSLNFSLFNPIENQIAGNLVLTFTASRNGNYMFTVGGINPDPTINAVLRYTITGKVTVTRPITPGPITPPSQPHH